MHCDSSYSASLLLKSSKGLPSRSGFVLARLRLFCLFPADSFLSTSKRATPIKHAACQNEENGNSLAYFSRMRRSWRRTRRLPEVRLESVADVEKLKTMSSIH